MDSICTGIKMNGLADAWPFILRIWLNSGKKKKRFAGAALMTAGGGLFLLCVVSALTIWWG